MKQKPIGTIAAINIDSAYEAGHATWAWVAFDREEKMLGYDYAYIGFINGMTCNIAEYYAALAALRYLKEQTVVTPVVIRGDSQLVIRQLRGEYGCRSATLVPLHAEAMRLSLSLNVRFREIGRVANAIADRFTVEAFPVDMREKVEEARKWQTQKRR